MKFQDASTAYGGEIGLKVVTLPVPALNNPEFYMVYANAVTGHIGIHPVAEPDNCIKMTMRFGRPMSKLAHSVSGFIPALSVDSQKPKEIHVLLSHLPEGLALDIDGDNFYIVVNHTIGSRGERTIGCFICRGVLAKIVSGIRWDYGIE